MPRTQSSRRKAASAALITVLATLALAACGGSSGKSTASTASGTPTASTPTTKTSTTPTTKGKAATKYATGIAALTACLAKSGIKLPSGGAAALLQEFQTGKGLPSGVSAVQARAALRRCGGFAAPAHPAAPPGSGKLVKPLGTPRAKRAVERFAACMRHQGLNLKQGVNTRSREFEAATKKCSAELKTGSSPSG